MIHLCISAQLWQNVGKLSTWFETVLATMEHGNLCAQRGLPDISCVFVCVWCVYTHICIFFAIVNGESDNHLSITLNKSFQYIHNLSHWNSNIFTNYECPWNFVLLSTHWSTYVLSKPLTYWWSLLAHWENKGNDIVAMDQHYSPLLQTLWW